VSGFAPIGPITLPSLTSLEGVQKDSPISKGSDIAGSFGKALDDARGLEASSEKMAEKFANGDTSIGIHEVMIETEKANVAIRYATTLKNKAVEAYRELMNTQV